MDRRKAGLAAGMVLVLVLGGSGAQAASPQRDPADYPCKGTATCSPADLAKLKEEAAKSEAAKSETAKVADPGADGSRCSADVKQPDSPDSGDLAQALADALGIGLDRAAAAVDDLKRVFPTGRIEPDSPKFAGVAARLGVPADRLNEALKSIKRANAPMDDAPSPGPTDVTPSPGTTPGS